MTSALCKNKGQQDDGLKVTDGVVHASMDLVEIFASRIALVFQDNPDTGDSAGDELTKKLSGVRDGLPGLDGNRQTNRDKVRCFIEWLADPTQSVTVR